MRSRVGMNSNLKWVVATLFLALFCRFFLISVYRISTDSLQPTLLPGDIILANQVAYGLKLPWMESGYFESDPKLGDIVIVKVKNKLADEYMIEKITEKNIQTLNRDQILSKAWVICISVESTQDSISLQKGLRWNRFLTMIK